MNKKMTFEDAAEKLDAIVEKLEGGEETLEGSLKLFEEGTALASFCYKKLSSAEQKITELTAVEEKKDGQD
jgi:exodeoxyribonuclease VII small subunit